MKAIIRVGLILAILGVISSGIFGLLANEALRAETVLTEVTYTYDKDDFSSINLAFDNNPIIIQKSETDEITIRFSHDKYETITETKTGTSLSIKVSSKWYERVFSGVTIFNMTNFFQDRKVYVSLPEVTYNLYVKTSNGQITLNGLTLDTVSLKTSNGMIGITDLNVSMLTADTSNGNIDMKDVVASLITSETSNGSLLFDNVNAPALEGKTSNGRITASNIVSANLKLNTSNGKINIKVVGNFADYKVRTSTSNGNVKINNQAYGNDTYHQEKTPYVSAKTFNGDISIEFLLD